MYKHFTIIPATLLAFAVIFSGVAQARNAEIIEEKTLIQAVESGDVESARQILSDNRGSYDVNARIPTGGTYLHAAAMQPNADMVQLLIDFGYNVNAIDNGGETPLHAAVGADNAEAVRILIENGANRTIRDKHGLTPLERAAQNNRANLVRYLENGAVVTVSY